MERRKRMSLFGGGLVTSTSSSGDHSRLRSARTRGIIKGTPLVSSSDRQSDKHRGKEEAQHAFVTLESSDPISETIASQCNVEENPHMVANDDDIKREEEIISHIEIKDIEDSVESNLLINQEARLGLRPKGTPLTLETARSLRQFLFGSSSPAFSEGWFHQGFEFNPPGSSLSYGLRQRKGGPCGIIAAVQAYILKHLIFEKPKKKALCLETIEKQREALMEALCSIFTKVASSNDEEGECIITLVSQGSMPHFSGIGNYYRSDGVTEKLEIHTFQHSVLRKNLRTHINAFYESDSGIICFLYSILMTKGVERIKKEMDTMDSPFIGAHGYCTQEMVNLLLTGVAASNTFDGSMSISDGQITLKGISSRSELGLLSLFEHYGSISVGEHLKDPEFPIWVLCSESHFSLLFSLHRPVRNELHYYDELAKQEGPIRILLSKEEQGKSSASPIEKCIRTKWKDVGISWEGSEPLL